MSRILNIIVCLGLAIASPPVFSAPTAEFNRYADQLSKKHHFDRKHILGLLKQAEPVKEVQEYNAKPITNLPWYQFKPYFVNPRRIENGAKFWKENEETLTRAQTEFGVPAAIIVSIIGIETKYGATIGNFRTFDALTTLGFYAKGLTKKRKEYFRSELTEFLLVARKQGWSEREVRGSYAGALGLAQFMPSSYRIYAIDYNGDGKVDLMHNVDDAIGSIGAYLKRKGWETNQPIAMRSDCKKIDFYMISQFKPSLTMEEWNQKCNVIVVDADDYPYYKLPASLFAIQFEDGPEYWNGFQNFYSILKYNYSLNYAMAVLELSAEIQKAHDGETHE